MGYCLLYPADYFEAGLPHAVSIAPEGFVFWESPPSVGIGVLDASGRNVRQLADKRITQLGFDPGRSSLTIGGEEAVVLADVGGQASSREVLIVHDDRLYTLGFILPDPEDSPGIERFERFYDTVINSFTFVPISVSPQALPEESQGTGGSAVVAFVKDGDVLVWEETTGQTETIFDSGDVRRPEFNATFEVWQ